MSLPSPDFSLLREPPVSKLVPRSISALRESAPDPNAKGPIFPPEHDLDNPVPGWPRLAHLMAELPEFASFSRFRHLNVKSLLYYQAELTRLQNQLHQQEWRDFRDENRELALYAKRADVLVQAEYFENAHEKVQWELIKKIRLTLKEYNDALLQYSQVSALSVPDDYSVRSVKWWLQSPKGGDLQIGGSSASTWGRLYEPESEPPSTRSQFLAFIKNTFFPRSKFNSWGNHDLVSTSPPRNIHGLTRWIADDWIPFYFSISARKWKRARKFRENNDIEMGAAPSRKVDAVEETLYRKVEVAGFMHMDTWLRIFSSVSTVIGCLLPTIAIAVLSRIQGTRNLLLCIAGFTTVFSIGLLALKNDSTSKVDVFAATAAFSAVLVVFISG